MGIIAEYLIKKRFGRIIIYCKIDTRINQPNQKNRVNVANLSYCYLKKDLK